MEHWVQSYIGKPFVYGGVDIDKGFDCYGMFKHVQEGVFGRSLGNIALPKYDIQELINACLSHGELNRWVETKEPSNGDAVLMGTGKYPTHVGVLVKDKYLHGVLHCIEKSGVIYNDISTLLLAGGWKVIRYYEYNTNK